MSKKLSERCLECVACYAHKYCLGDLAELPDVILEELAGYISAAELLRLQPIFNKSRVSTEAVWHQLLHKWPNLGRALQYWMTRRPSWQVYLVCLYHLLLRAPTYELLEAYRKFYSEGVKWSLTSLPPVMQNSLTLAERKQKDLLLFAPHISHLSLFPQQMNQLLQNRSLLDELLLSVTHLRLNVLHVNCGPTVLEFCSYMATHGSVQNFSLQGQLSHSIAEQLFQLLKGVSNKQDKMADSKKRGVSQVEIHSLEVEHLGSLINNYVEQSEPLESLELSFLRESSIENPVEWDQLRETLLTSLLNGNLKTFVCRYCDLFSCCSLMEFLCSLADHYDKNVPLDKLQIEETVKIHDCVLHNGFSNIYHLPTERVHSLVKDFELKITNKHLTKFAVWLVRHNPELNRLCLEDYNCEKVDHEQPKDASSLSVLIKDLSKCLNLQVLKLTQMHLHYDDMELLGQSLPSMCQLNTLHVSDCRFSQLADETVIVLEKFYSALSNHPSLRKVGLAQNRLGQYGVDLLKHILKVKGERCTPLKSLDLSGNWLPLLAMLKLGEEFASTGLPILGQTGFECFKMLDLRGIKPESYEYPVVKVHRQVELVNSHFGPWAEKLLITKNEWDPFAEYVAQM